MGAAPSPKPFQILLVEDEPVIRELVRSMLTDGDVQVAVDASRAAAAGRDVGLFGADLAGQCVAAGLVDEIIIHLAPVLLGGGVRLYGGPRVDLERLPATATLPDTPAAPATATLRDTSAPATTARPSGRELTD